MTISVICVYNNVQKLDSQLKASLETQQVNYEFIGINNKDGVYSSAAMALNYGALVAHGEVLIFSHQDIFLKTPMELEKLANVISGCPTGTIVGTQGVKEPSKIYYTNLTSGSSYNSDIIKKFEDKIYQVSCVDEGLFGMKKTTWERHNFDESICDNWHLYAVEQCLYARKNGHNVYVFPSQIHHFSRGKINLKYMNGLKKMCAEYRKHFKYIWTTCYKVRTGRIYIDFLVFAWKLNRVVKHRGME